MKKIYLFAVSTVCLIACTKDETADVTSFPVELYSVRYQNTTKVRAFTQQGEIKNQFIADRLGARFTDDWSGNTWFFYELDSSLDSRDTLRIVSADTALFKENSSVQKYRIGKSGVDFQFTPLDTGIIFSSDTYYNNLIDAIRKYKPIYSLNETVPGPTGIVTRRKVVIGRYAAGNFSRLNFPVMTSGVINSGIYYVFSENNHFNEEGYKQLRVDDTLIVQEFELVYKK